MSVYDLANAADPFEMPHKDIVPDPIKASYENLKRLNETGLCLSPAQNRAKPEKDGEVT